MVLLQLGGHAEKDVDRGYREDVGNRRGAEEFQGRTVDVEYPAPGRAHEDRVLRPLEDRPVFCFRILDPDFVKPPARDVALRSPEFAKGAVFNDADQVEEEIFFRTVARRPVHFRLFEVVSRRDEIPDECPVVGHRGEHQVLDLPAAHFRTVPERASPP